jgi:glycosyltransferase involved in cell wall biosynthesis
VQRLPADLNWRLLIVGDGELRQELEQTAHRLGIADRTVFAGRRADVPEVLQAMDLFVLPSRVEALPMALLEAMASGVPVVASDVGDVARILQQGALGVIVPAGEVVALSGALYEVLARIDVARTRAGLAREQVRQLHSSERMARDYLGIYARAAAARAKA